MTPSDGTLSTGEVFETRSVQRDEREVDQEDERRVCEALCRHERRSGTKHNVSKLKTDVGYAEHFETARGLYRSIGQLCQHVDVTDEIEPANTSYVGLSVAVISCGKPLTLSCLLQEESNFCCVYQSKTDKGRTMLVKRIAACTHLSSTVYKLYSDILVRNCNFFLPPCI